MKLYWMEYFNYMYFSSVNTMWKVGNQNIDFMCIENSFDQKMILSFQ